MECDSMKKGLRTLRWADRDSTMLACKEKSV
jgi:hypothetical protein